MPSIEDLLIGLGGGLLVFISVMNIIGYVELSTTPDLFGVVMWALMAVFGLYLVTWLLRSLSPTPRR